MNHCEHSIYLMHFKTTFITTLLLSICVFVNLFSPLIQLTGGHPLGLIGGGLIGHQLFNDRGGGWRDDWRDDWRGGRGRGRGGRWRGRFDRWDDWDDWRGRGRGGGWRRGGRGRGRGGRRGRW